MNKVIKPERLTVKDIRKIFMEKLLRADFLESSSGKMLDIVGATFIADEESIFGEPNRDYIRKEIDWYSSQSRNVYDIEGTVPKIWQMVASRTGEINSNYGWCVFSEENGLQYKNTLRKLKKDKHSRQAIMIFNRPSMHTDWNFDGRSDFMCCQNVQALIRNDKLDIVVNFRSNDARFGYLNDYAYMKHLRDLLFDELVLQYKDLQIGDIIWNAGSLHVYERDFDLVSK